MRPGDPLPVASTKYDGSHHYRYLMEVVAVEPDRLLAFSPAGTPMDSYRGRFPARDHVLNVHLRDRDWNLTVHWQADWAPRSHYVNIALPSTWDDGTLRFVDLDLDVIWRADGLLVLDDEDEFDEHRVRWGYPQEVVDRCWAAVAEVKALIEKRAAPFDGNLYYWRPWQMSQSSGQVSQG